MISQRELIKYLELVGAVAQAGLTYSNNSYDIERFINLREATARFISKINNNDFEKISELLSLDGNYPTPKIDVRAVVFNEKNQILMVCEKQDGLWTLPGGWCDIGESPSEAVVRELYEETGLIGKALSLLAFFDKHKHDHPPQMPHAYKAFFLCHKIDGQLITQTNETINANYFDISNIPQLSLHRVTKSQILTLSNMYFTGSNVTKFD